MTDEPPQVEVLDPDQLPDDPPDFHGCEEACATPAGLLALTSPTQVPVTWLPKTLALWGVRYRLVAGWEDRGRPPSSGGFNPKGRLLVHHTGSKSSATNPYPALGLLTRGRSDLTGPLCQVSPDYNGVVSIVAAGRANHAGKARAFGSAPAGDGNALWLGMEVDTNGLQRMPTAQYAAIVLTACAIFHHEGIKPSQVPDYLGLHNSTSYSGKWDLGAGTGVSGAVYPLRNLVADVQRRLAAGPPVKPAPTPTPPPNPSPQEESTMFVYQMTGHPDPKVAATKVVSDGFRMRQLSYLGWVRLNGAYKYQHGEDLYIVKVKDLDGVALEWVGPQIMTSDGTPLQLPASVKVVE